MGEMDGSRGDGQSVRNMEQREGQWIRWAYWSISKAYGTEVGQWVRQT